MFKLRHKRIRAITFQCTDSTIANRYLIRKSGRSPELGDVVMSLLDNSRHNVFALQQAFGIHF